MIAQPPSPLRAGRRLLFAGAGLGGVLLVVLLLVRVFEGGGDQGEVPSAPPRPVTTGAPEANAAEARATVPVASAPAEGRDPFVPVVRVPRQAGSAQGSSQPPHAPAQATQSATATPSTPGQLADTAYAFLELKSISLDPGGVRRAHLTVDGQSHSAAEGETFSYGYRLERVDGDCVEVSAQTARARMCVPAPAR